MAYTLGNKCAKNLCKRIVILQLIIENVVTCFFGTQCIIMCIVVAMTCYPLLRNLNSALETFSRWMSAIGLR